MGWQFWIGSSLILHLIDETAKARKLGGGGGKKIGWKTGYTESHFQQKQRNYGGSISRLIYNNNYNEAFPFLEKQ